MEIVSTEEGTLLVKHLHIAGNLFRLIAIGKWLVKQFYQKKAQKEKDGSYTFTNKETKSYLDSHLLQGKKGELHEFPILRDKLQKSLRSQVKERDLIEVYYKHEKKPKHLRFDEFSKYDWWLSKGPVMSPEDLLVMGKYKDFLVSVLEETATLCPKGKKEREKLLVHFSDFLTVKKNC